MGGCSHESEIMSEQAICVQQHVYELNRVVFVNCELQSYEHNFGDLRISSIADHMLISATAFFTFCGSHKSVHRRRISLTYFSCFASSAQPVAVKIFLGVSSQHLIKMHFFRNLNLNNFEERIIVKRLHTLSSMKFQHIVLSSHRT